MQSMRCLAIGISDAPPLDYLPGAANGAKAFAAWATAQGCTTELLTDETTPVGFTDVKAALLRLLEGPEQIFRLIVYFAGHGLARDAAEDLWLLSEWQTDQRGIAVNGLRRKLNRYGLTQLTIVGDACRSLPVDDASADLTADGVLGWGPYDTVDTSVDFLRASASFHAAYMVAGDTISNYRCIFSGVLQEALSGTFDGAFDKDRDVITSFSLAECLKKEVPARAATYNVVLKPSVVPGFAPPDNVYLAGRPATPPVASPWPANLTQVGVMGTGAAPNTILGQRGWSTRGGAAPPAPDKPRRQGFFNLDISKILSKIAVSNIAVSNFTRGTSFEVGPSLPQVPNVILPDPDEPQIPIATQIEEKAVALQQDYLAEGDRPTHYETNAGLSLAGTTAKTVLLGRFAKASDDRDRRWWQVVPSGTPEAAFWSNGALDQPLPAIVELENGNWTAAAVLPGYIGTLSVVDDGVASLIYRPMTHPDAGKDTEAAVARMRAGGLTPEDAFDLAATLRDEKEADPVRGVLAAYLYDSQADTQSVLRTAYWLASNGVPVPFDLLLLGRVTCRRDGAGRLMATIPATIGREPRSDEEARRFWTYQETPAIACRVAGILPWLRQGWDVLDGDHPSLVPTDDLQRLRPLLLPHPFTTLKPESGPLLREIMESF